VTNVVDLSLGDQLPLNLSEFTHFCETGDTEGRVAPEVADILWRHRKEMIKRLRKQYDPELN